MRKTRPRNYNVWKTFWTRRALPIFWKVVPFFRKSDTIFQKKVVPFFRKSGPIFIKIGPFFRKSGPIFLKNGYIFLWEMRSELVNQSAFHSMQTWWCLCSWVLSSSLHNFKGFYFEEVLTCATTKHRLQVYFLVRGLLFIVCTGGLVGLRYLPSRH